MKIGEVADLIFDALSKRCSTSFAKNENVRSEIASLIEVKGDINTKQAGLNRLC